MRMMDPDQPTPLLGGLTPAAFMRRHWHKRPLLVRQALPGVAAPVSREALFDLAARDDVESRLVTHEAGRWRLRHGPLPRRGLPPLRRPGWTLLVQGLDLHVQAAHELLAAFRFVPDARLDDLMLSYASDGGGVGPHVDSYDVFLLQVEGKRRWRVGRPGGPDGRACLPDAPLRILSRFEPESEWLLEPGDMLYLPPHWAHDGVAEGACMTCSIGFRASTRAALGAEVLRAVVDAAEDAAADEVDGDDDPGGALRYADPRQPATTTPARIPPPLQAFAVEAVRRLLAQPDSLAQALGEVLSEPKPGVHFDPPPPPRARRGRAATRDVAAPRGGVVLDRRSRMLYDDRFVYLNGEAWRCAGADGRALRELADRRRLGPRRLGRASEALLSALAAWCAAGWMHALPLDEDENHDAD